MIIRIISTGQEGQHSTLFPNVSFAPGDIDCTPEWLASVGAEQVILPAPPAPTNEQLISSLLGGLDRYFDSVAQSRHYDNRLTCALRAGYAGPFQAEGIAFATWMDECYNLAFGRINEANSLDELTGSFPTLVW